MNPLISILIPVYRVERFIERCATSIFSQTYDNLEIIFVDDKTPDASVDVLKQVLEQYPDRLPQTKIIHHKENKGLSGARNTAVAAATGDYVLHIDSDDFIESDTVSHLVNKAIIANADIVFFNMRHLFTDGEYIEKFALPENTFEIVKALLTYKVPVCLCGKLIKRSLYVKNNIHSFEGINFGEDYAVTPRLAYYANNIVHLDEPLYNYIHTNTTSYTGSYKSKNIDDLIKVGSLHKDFFKDKGAYAALIDYAFAEIKANLLIAIGLHPKEVGHRKKEIAAIWNNIDSKAIKSLSIPYKGILFFSHMPLPLLSMYTGTALRLKFLLKKLKAK